MRRTLIACAAVGCLAALFFDEPQRRFVAALLGVLSPFIAYGLALLLTRLAIVLTIFVRRYNWRQFSLRGLLVFMIVCAIGSLIWSWTRPDIRYRRMREQQELAEAVEPLGGNVNDTLINLNGQVIEDSHLACLAALPGAKEVVAINLNGTGVTDQVTKHLCLFPKLRSITMNGCLASTDEALKPLHGKRRLRFLDLHETQVTDAGVEALMQSNQRLLLIYWDTLNPVFLIGDPDKKRSVEPVATE